MKGDATYLLRLNVSCPGVIDDNSENNDTSEPIIGDDEFTFADIEIRTNMGPILQLLEVKPKSGIAFETIFSFDTLNAADQGVDYPILYKFGYVIGSKTIYFCRITEVIRFETFLPFDGRYISNTLYLSQNSN